jgi:hypothetical protein
MKPMSVNFYFIFYKKKITSLGSPSPQSVRGMKPMSVNKTNDIINNDYY